MVRSPRWCFYILTVTMPRWFDMCVPEQLLALDREHIDTVDAVIPYDLGVHPLTLPEGCAPMV
ncbi:MAG: hypothetical protein ACXVDA_14780 [Ktedonobacterales bacterium]